MDDATKSQLAGVSADGSGGRRQERSRATRRELVDAARFIFARDGFEATRLEDIAAAAGKTRGAFYANFKDKEDVFFAIVEDDIAHDGQLLLEGLSTACSTEGRMDVLARYLLKLLDERPRMLLSIEFKLYTIRRPQHHARLAALHAEMCVRCAEMHIDHLLPELSHSDPERKRRKAAIFGSVLDGLVLNRLFQPGAMKPDDMLALIKAAIRVAWEQPREENAQAASMQAVSSEPV